MTGKSAASRYEPDDVRASRVNSEFWARVRRGNNSGPALLILLICFACILLYLRSTGSTPTQFASSLWSATLQTLGGAAGDRAEGKSSRLVSCLGGHPPQRLSVQWVAPERHAGERFYTYVNNTNVPLYIKLLTAPGGTPLASMLLQPGEQLMERAVAAQGHLELQVPGTTWCSDAHGWDDAEAIDVKGVVPFAPGTTTILVGGTAATGLSVHIDRPAAHTRAPANTPRPIPAP